VAAGAPRIGSRCTERMHVTRAGHCTSSSYARAERSTSTGAATAAVSCSGCYPPGSAESPDKPSDCPEARSTQVRSPSDTKRPPHPSRRSTSRGQTYCSQPCVLRTLRGDRARASRHTGRLRSVPLPKLRPSVRRVPAGVGGQPDRQSSTSRHGASDCHAPSAILRVFLRGRRGPRALRDCPSAVPLIDLTMSI
jgi:hypothetical protein